ncbi:MAG: hypothetical protein V4726_10440 [Verrucomicrobiota bacterium]
MNAAPTVASPAVPEPGVTVAGLRDFSDRLSPMLVKELRQGMRSPVFVWGLIAMNLFLVMIVWLTIEAPASEDLNQAFFGAYCVLVCGLLPLRGANALNEELRGNTIDTLVLTRLSGWRITLGKWIAVAAQQLLTTVTVLPYLIVRYFAGGLNVPLEMAWLGIFLLLGLLSAAVLTGFSWVKYFLLRAGIMLGVTAAAGSFCAGVLEDMYDYHNSYIIDEMHERYGWTCFALALTAVLHVMFYALDIGAAQVAAVSENRTTRRRLIGLAAVGIYVALSWGAYRNSLAGGPHHREDSMVAVGCVLAILTSLVLILQSLLEKPANLAPVLQPFVKRGFAGRLAGRVLYPGWPSGVIFSLMLFLTALGIGAFTAWRAWENRYTGYGYSGYRSGAPFDLSDVSMNDWAVAICGFAVIPFTLPVPLVLYHWFFRRRLNWHLGTYALMLTLMASAQLLLIALAAGLTNADFLKIGVPIPTMSWAWLEYIARDDYYFNVRAAAGEPPDPNILNWTRPLLIVISLAVGAFWWIMAVWLSLRAFRETAAVERHLKLKPGAEQLTSGDGSEISTA